MTYYECCWHCSCDVPNRHTMPCKACRTAAVLDDYDPVPGLVARGVMSDDHDPDSCEAGCCFTDAEMRKTSG